MVAPILERHGVPFTVYVPSGAVTRDLQSWWLGLRALFQDNDQVEIGCMGMRFESRDWQDKVMAFRRVSQWVHADYSRAALFGDTFRRYGVSLPALNEQYFLDENELRVLARSPQARIGAHTVSHPALSLLSAASVRHEFEDNRRYLESIVDAEVVDLAYPYGTPDSCAEREFALAAETGFRSAVTSQFGALRARDAQFPLALPRVACDGNVDFSGFVMAAMTLQ